MSEMLERMKNALAAAAVWPPQGDHPAACDCARCGAFRKQARAELAAMREPTAEMLIAARDWSARKYGKPIGDDAAVGCWQAMIDAALGEDR